MYKLILILEATDKIQKREALTALEFLVWVQEVMGVYCIGMN